MIVTRLRASPRHGGAERFGSLEPHNFLTALFLATAWNASAPGAVAPMERLLLRRYYDNLAKQRGGSCWTGTVPSVNRCINLLETQGFFKAKMLILVRYF